MVSGFRINQALKKWQQLSQRTKILGLVLLVTSLVSGSILLHWLYLSLNEPEFPAGGEPPYAHFGLRIANETVYANGIVRFTVVCYGESYGGYPLPEEDLYQITQAFICTENDLLEFNATLGEIKDPMDLKIMIGDFNLAVNDTLSLEFQTSFPLTPGFHLYIGVFANGPTGLHRWDLYTTVLFPEISIH